MPNSFRLFRLFGINVYLHYAWFIAVVYDVQTRKGNYSNIGWNIAEILSLFAIVLTHEFGHALACRSVGGKAEKIILWPLGGIAYVNAPQRPGAMLWSIVAGPLVNVILVPITYGLTLLNISGNADLAHFVNALFGINLVLLIFNMLPIYPLDGGKILWSLLWFVMGRGRSLMVASVIGMVALAGGLVWAAFQRDLWLILIAAWAGYQAWNGFQQARIMHRIDQMPKRQGFACPNCGQPPFLGPFWICGKCRNRYDAFENHGVCPHCGAYHEYTSCPLCGKGGANRAWQMNARDVPTGATNPAVSVSEN